MSATFTGCGRWTSLKNKVGLTKEGAGHGEHSPDGDGDALPATNLSLRHYSDCAELQADVRMKLERQMKMRGSGSTTHSVVREFADPRENYGGPAMPNNSPSVDASDDVAVDSDSNKVFTNVQEKGIDEADGVKVGAHHIYALLLTSGKSHIEVTDRKSLKSLGTLSLPADAIKPTLFVDGDHLAVVYNQSGTKTACHAIVNDDGINSQTCSPMPINRLVVEMYTATPSKLPTLDMKHELGGQYSQARSIDNRLILVSSDALKVAAAIMNEEIPEEPVYLDDGDEGKIQGLSCDQYAQPVIDDEDFRLTKIYSLNLSVPKEAPQAVAIVGGGDWLYMSEDHLYVSKQGIKLATTPIMESIEAQNQWQELRQSLVITQVDFDKISGALNLSASGRIEGVVKDQWAFKEYVAPYNQPRVARRWTPFDIFECWHQSL
jgi:hypothetical protein